MLSMSAPGTFRTSSKLQDFDSLNQFRPLIFHIAYRSRYRVPGEMVGGCCSVDCYLFSFLPAYILAHPFTCCFRRHDQRPAVVNIYQPFICCCGDNQKAFGFVSTFKWCTPDCRHEDGLAIFTVDEIGLLLVAFFFPFEPSISKADRPAMLPERFKRSTSGCRLDACVNQRRFIPPPGCVTPVNRIEVQLFVSFAQEQNFSPRRHVVTPNRLRVVCDVALGFIRQVCQIFLRVCD